MKQKLRLLFMALLCAVCHGAWAQEVTYDFTGSDWSVTNGVLTNGTVTINGSGSANFKMNSGYFMLGKKGAYITLPAYDFNVGRIEVVGNSGASSSVVMNVFVDDEAVSTQTTGSTGTNTYDIDSEYQENGTQYTIKVLSAHNAQITQIKVYEATSDPSISIEDVTVNGEEEVELDVDLRNYTGAITFTSNPEGAVTVTETDGVYTLTATESAVVTATLGSTGVSTTFNVTYVAPFTVQDGIFDFTQYGYGMDVNSTGYNPNPTTIEAGNVSIELAGNNNSRYWQTSDPSYELRTYKACTMTVSVPVGKEITKIEFELNSTTGRIQADGYSDGVWEGQKREVEFKFSDSSYIKKITVTYGDAQPRIEIDPSETTVPAEGGNGTLDIVAYSLDMSNVADGLIEFCTEEGQNASAPSWLELTVSSDDTTIDYTVQPNDGEARTAYFKVSYSFIDDASPIYSEIVTINQEAYVEPIESKAYELVTSADDLAAGDKIIIVNEAKDYAISTTQNTNNRAATAVSPEEDETIIPSSDVQVITLEQEDGKWYFNVSTGYLFAASNSSNHLKTEPEPDANGNASAAIAIDDNGVATITFQGKNSRNLMRFNPNGSNPMFACYASTSTTGTAVRIYREISAVEPVEPFILTISDKACDSEGTYYATVSALGEGNFIVPEDAEVSTITIDNGQITRTSSFGAGDVISGEEAYLVEATRSGAFEFAPTTAEAGQPGENWLYPAIAGEKITAPDPALTYRFYKLSLNKNSDDYSVGFYYGAANGAPFTFTSPNKAYLAVPQGNTSDTQTTDVIPFDDKTGIDVVTSEAKTAEGIFTLTGVRIDSNKLQKGVYIVNGKKQIIK